MLGLGLGVNRNVFIGGFDADAILVINKMTNPTSAQQDAINTFVIAEKAAGNWTNYDHILCPSMGDVTNGLVDWIQTNDGTDINSGIFSANGYTADGTTQYVDSGFDATTDAINYLLNDATFGAFMQDASEGGGNPAIFGLLDSTNQISLFEASGSGSGGLNGKTAVLVSTSVPTADSQLYAISRISNTQVRGTVNGATDTTSASNVTVIPPGNVFILNRNGGTLYFAGTFSFSFASNHSGMNFVSQNTNVRTLLTSLGASI